MLLTPKPLVPGGLQLAAALTTVGIAGTWANDNLPSASDMPWWMIVLLAAGSVSAVLAILTILLQVPRGCPCRCRCRRHCRCMQLCGCLTAIACRAMHAVPCHCSG